jgi:AraC family transcriptional regulator
LINNDSIFIGVGLDNPDITHPDKCRYYASISLDHEVDTPNNIEKMTLKGGQYVVARYEGDDLGIVHAYRTLFGKWIPENGFIPRDEPGYEIYIHTPDNADKDHPKKHFIMDICIPVMPLK